MDQSVHKSLNMMLPLLTSADIPETEGEGWKSIHAFTSSVVAHSNSEIAKHVVPLYDELHAFANTTKSTLELIVGVGHVRLVYNINKAGDEESQERILNGPLLEIPMQVQLDRKTDDLLLRPTEEAKVTFNTEVMTGIIAGGGVNEFYLNQLYGLAE